MTQGYDALTEKEKQTLRLLIAGHDAKSMARHLGLSVHTVNERLRDARRKLSVSSSREAARLLRQSEAELPEKVGDMAIGDAAPPRAGQQAGQRRRTSPSWRRAAWVFGGFAAMSIFVAALALLAPAAPPQAETAPTAAIAETDAARVARNWLTLVDASDWAGSYAGTGSTFHSHNSLAGWRAASEKVRVPLGRVVSRTLIDDHDVPAAPNGAHNVRFRTDFANRPGAIENLVLVQEGGAWEVAGIYIE